MRILTISDLYPPVAFGGYEIDCAAMVAALRTEHEVVVLTSRLRRSTTAPEHAVLRELPWTGVAAVRGTLLAPSSAAAGVRTTRRVLEQVRPDLVIVCNAMSIPQAAVSATLASGVPVALRLAETFFAQHLLRSDRFLRHLQADPQERGPLRLWGGVVRMLNHGAALRVEPLMRRSVAVAWASEDLATRVRLPPALDLVHQRVIYPRSPHAAGFAGLERRPLAEPTVLYLGRVTTGKGIEVAYRALASLRDQHGVPARLEVVGTASPATLRQLRRLADELGITAAVRLHGQLTSHEFADQMQTAHAIVVPSLESEVFGLVVMEAALARLPIVASNLGGIPEAVRDGEHALLFEPGDAEACAAALADTLRRPGAAAARAERAYARMTELSMDSYAEQWKSFVVDAVDATTVRRD